MNSLTSGICPSKMIDWILWPFIKVFQFLNVLIEKYEKCQSIKGSRHPIKFCQSNPSTQIFCSLHFCSKIIDDVECTVKISLMERVPCMLKLMVMYVGIFLINYQLKWREFRLFYYTESFNTRWLACMIFNLILML